jgi:hypothetical protein
MKNRRNGSDRLWRSVADLASRTAITLSPKELRILQAVAGHVPRNLQIQAPHSPPTGMHETSLVETTGIPLDELMMLRRDKYDRVRRNGLIQTLSAKLLIGLTDGDRADRFGYAWITPAGLEASRPWRQSMIQQRTHRTSIRRCCMKESW